MDEAKLVAALMCAEVEIGPEKVTIREAFNEAVIHADGSMAGFDLFIAVLPRQPGERVAIEVHQVCPTQGTWVVYEGNVSPPGATGMSWVKVVNPFAKQEAGLHLYEFFLDGNRVLSLPFAMVRSSEL